MDRLASNCSYCQRYGEEVNGDLRYRSLIAFRSGPFDEPDHLGVTVSFCEPGKEGHEVSSSWWIEGIVFSSAPHTCFVPARPAGHPVGIETPFQAVEFTRASKLIAASGWLIGIGRHGHLWCGVR